MPASSPRRSSPVPEFLPQLLEGNASLFDLEPLTAADRDSMVEKLEDNASERERIQNELKRISISGD